MPDYGDILRNKEGKQPSEVEKRAIQTRHVGSRAGDSKASRLETSSTLELHELVKMRRDFGDGHRQISAGLYIDLAGPSAKDCREMLKHLMNRLLMKWRKAMPYR